MGNLITLGPVTRTVPDWIARQLRDTDPNLIVYFNEHRDRWIIDRCTRDGEMKSTPHTHTSACPKTNVMILEDEGAYMPLCDEAINKIRSMDTWKFRSYENYHRDNANRAAADAEDRKRKIKESYREASLDNKRQLNEAYTLVQRHDTARINQ